MYLLLTQTTLFRFRLSFSLVVAVDVAPSPRLKSRNSYRARDKLLKCVRLKILKSREKYSAYLAPLACSFLHFNLKKSRIRLMPVNFFALPRYVVHLFFFLFFYYPLRFARCRLFFFLLSVFILFLQFFLAILFKCKYFAQITSEQSCAARGN